MRLNIFIILFIIYLCSCKKDIYENFALLQINGEYNFIFTNGICDIRLKNDTISKIVIEYNPENHFIKNKIFNDTLYLNFEIRHGLKPIKNKPLVNIFFRDIKKLVTRGPSYVFSDDTIKFTNIVYYSIGEIGSANLKLNCNIFDMANSANTLGHYYFKGIVNYLILYNRYGSTIFADSVNANNALIINESAGDVYVNVKKQLDVYIQGTGNIFCKNKPEILNIIEDRGKGGKIIFLN